MNTLKDRHNIGSVQILYKGVITKSPIGSLSYDSFISNIENMFDYDVCKIPPGAEHRPDIISNIFYGSPSYWWLLMQANNVFDPFEGFNVGDRILIPKLL